MSCKHNASACWVCLLQTPTPCSTVQGFRRWGLAAASNSEGQGQRVWPEFWYKQSHYRPWGGGVIQKRSSVSKYWLWKQMLVHIQIIRALAKGSIPGNSGYQLKETVRHSKRVKMYSMRLQSCINIVWDTKVRKHQKKAEVCLLWVALH